MIALVRPFRASDLDPLVELMRNTLELPSLNANTIVRDFLLADATTVLIAECDGTLAGFMLAPAGWIAAFGVAPAWRRRGIATALLGQAIAEMRSAGLPRIDVADVPVRYLLPGVDRAAFPAAYTLLTERFGFTIRDEVASMGIAPASAVAASAIRPCTPGEYPLLRDFLLREFDPGWWAFFARAIAARLEGDPMPGGILCHWVDGCPHGAVQFRGNRFGPLAVAAGLRGQGIGARLTLAILAAMHAQGLTDAYFMIAAPDVQPFYRRLGFQERRRFTRLTL